MVKVSKKYCREFVIDDLAFQCKGFSTLFFCNIVDNEISEKKISRKCVTLKFSFIFERLKNYKHNWPKM